MDAMRNQHGLSRSSVDEYLRLFGTWDPQDHAAFHRRIEECVPFLEEIGVRVRRIECSREPGATTDAEAEGDQDHPYWTVEVPAWKHKRGFWD